jgi:hypothetical protein
MAGSLNQADILFQGCLGCISHKWAKAALAYQPKHSNFHPDCWAAELITYMWQFTEGLSAHRNQIVHGANVEKQAAILLE